ncbi:hypothetical protein [Streptomyces anthocyanicus]|nr:hypothetical protein [Streptomyces anthocyanicus]
MMRRVRHRRPRLSKAYCATNSGFEGVIVTDALNMAGVRTE